MVAPATERMGSCPSRDLRIVAAGTARPATHARSSLDQLKPSPPTGFWLYAGRFIGAALWGAVKQLHSCCHLLQPHSHPPAAARNHRPTADDSQLARGRRVGHFRAKTFARRPVPGTWRRLSRTPDGLGTAGGGQASSTPTRQITQWLGSMPSHRPLRMLVAPIPAP